MTDDTVLGYYYSPAAGDNSTPHSYGRPEERHFRPMEGVEEDAASEWSGYESVSDDDEAWEDADEFGMKADCRRTAAERLREYRREN